MGLTNQSVAQNAALDIGTVVPKEFRENSKIIALAGNPNVGKSSIFNILTGMKQHTGNWPGKTVTNAVGRYKDSSKNFVFVDIPGTYSLMAHSAEEEVARDFILFGGADAVIVVCDATCLERNLNLCLQAIEINPNVIVCVNLMDEAEKKGIYINLKALSQKLGVRVVGTSARNGRGIKKLISELDLSFNVDKKSKVVSVTYHSLIEKSIKEVENTLKPLNIYNRVSYRWLAIKLLEQDENLIRSIEKHFKVQILDNEKIKNCVVAEQKILNSNGISIEKFKDYIVSGLILTAEDICDDNVITLKEKKSHKNELRLDKFLTGKITGPLVMILLLAVIFWITIWGANIPSDYIWRGLSFIESKLLFLVDKIGVPQVISDMLILGVYRVLAWVISVMLPPMAIFFPLFTLLEDLGYLPRVAFNLDKAFQKCSACGKQALTMCMGFGCNAAGITGARIIDSKRERLVAIITNNFVPCNGRFPTLIAIITMFFIAGINSNFKTPIAALILTAVIVFGIIFTFLVSRLLTSTLLKGEPSSFTLELPPFRKPKIMSILVRSIFDRTIFVLGRAVAVAAPAGLVIWLMANISVSGQTLLWHCSSFLDPFGRLMGLDGVILIGFILGFPANEIVVPIIIMAYLSKGTLTDYSNLFELKALLVNNGWTTTTAICTMVFCLMHWPCSTALITIKKETNSLFWTFISAIVPTIIGIILCIFINLVSTYF